MARFKTARAERRALPALTPATVFIEAPDIFVPICDCPSRRQFHRFHGRIGRIRRPRRPDSCGDDRANAVVKQTKTLVAARCATTPEIFELPERDKLLIGVNSLLPVLNFIKWSDKCSMAAPRRRDDKATRW